MWTFDNFPAAAVKEKYDVAVDAAWLERVRLSTVRLPGCTAVFASADGAFITNHHCVSGCIDQLSTADNDVMAHGFLARAQRDEKRCATQIADMLVATENVTEQIAKATRGHDEKAANEARKKALTLLEQSCEEASKADRRTGSLKCEAVSLYDGGQYFLYKYKRYTDVRMVFAPEFDIAFFGGDPDNFQFPRWGLDIAVLRAYENGKPVRPRNHLRIDFNGPQAGDPVFVVGHPGSTDRLLTVSQLLSQRTVDLPSWLLRSSELRGRLIQFGKTSDEARRVAGDVLFGIENSIKVYRKQLDALLDDREMQRKRDAEQALRRRIAQIPALQKSAGSAWDDIDRALAVESAIHDAYTQIEAGLGFNSKLFRYARTLVRGAAERDKPNHERLREYVDTRLPRLEQQLGAPMPFYPDLELTTFSFSLERMRETLGPDHPVVRSVLGNQSPDRLVNGLIESSRLADPKVRLELWKGGSAAMAASTDSMIQLAKSIDAEARALRKTFEDQVEAPIKAASERIAAARFAVLGTTVYPDATYTLRINYGSVQGWREAGRDIAPFTRLSGLFERATGAEPFKVPKTWESVRSQLNMDTPFNLSSNNDIVGGNSGSALINAKGDVVGVIFDGNIHSISGAFWFDTEKNRAVSVHPAILREALSKVYRADALLKELEK